MSFMHSTLPLNADQLRIGVGGARGDIASAADMHTSSSSPWKLIVGIGVGDRLPGAPRFMASIAVDAT
jgi:hypothetical protein